MLDYHKIRKGVINRLYSIVNFNGKKEIPNEGLRLIRYYEDGLPEKVVRTCFDQAKEGARMGDIGEIEMGYFSLLHEEYTKRNRMPSTNNKGRLSRLPRYIFTKLGKRL